MIRGVVLLGNPGTEYGRTRHNIGWMLAAVLPWAADLRWEKKFNGVYAGYVLNGIKRWLLKPGLYMNRSGECAAAFARFFQLTPGELLAVHDELELPFAQCSCKQGGGTAGHNGLRSLAACLGSSDFGRLRLGIGRPARGSVSAFVLSRFTPDEEIQLPAFLDEAARTLDRILSEGS